LLTILLFAAGHVINLDVWLYAFAKSGTSNTMAGIIPENIFKANRNGIVTGVFNNQVVIPRLVGSTTSGSETINVYV
jgi:hypothetical protein